MTKKAVLFLYLAILLIINFILIVESYCSSSPYGYYPLLAPNQCYAAWNIDDNSTTEITCDVCDYQMLCEKKMGCAPQNDDYYRRETNYVLPGTACAGDCYNSSLICAPPTQGRHYYLVTTKHYFGSLRYTCNDPWQGDTTPDEPSTTMPGYPTLPLKGTFKVEDIYYINSESCLVTKRVIGLYRECDNFRSNCDSCTNGQTQACTISDCPNGGVQTCTNSQWGSCQCTPCTDGDLQNCPCSADAPLFSSANIVSGNLSHEQDLFTASSGVGLSMMLYYDSLNTYTGPVGKKWTHTYDIKLITMSDGSIILGEGNGHGKRYTKSGSSYISQAGDYSTLIKNSDGTYVITHKDNTKYNFNADGKITSIVDRNNNAITMSYTGGNLTAVTDPVGRSAVFSYNADNRISAIIDPNGNTYSFTYSNNVLVNVSTQIPQLETLNWSYTYDQDFFMLTKTDPNNNTTTYTYDTNYRVVKAVNPEGQTKTITYTPGTKLSQMTETDGGIWTYKYDTQLGVLLQKIDPNGNTTTYTYDQNKNMLSQIDPDGTSTSYIYDSYGNMTSLTDPLGNTTAYTYNNYGQATSITDSQGNITSYSYNSKGNLISMTDATVAATQYQFDSKGNVIGITNANGQTTTLSYDQYNNISSMTDAAGATTRFTYNAAGNMISQTDSQGNITTFAYNNLNQLIKITDPQNNITTYTYDKNGNKISQTDANGNITYYEYNYKNQIIKVTDSLGGITVYAYGGTGCGSCGSGGGDKLVSITDAKGNKTTYEYNSLGKLIKETDPLGNSTAYSYDSKGNLISKTDANGNTIQYTYDALSRLTQKTYPDGSAEAFQYDSKGNITYAGNQYIAYSFAYDANGKITGVRDSNNRTILYQYDMLGNKIKMTIPEGKNIEYKYNSSNRLDKILSDAGTFTFTYDSLGRRTKLLYPTGATANYIYDSVGRLTSLTHKTSKGHIIDKYKYTLDKVGNRLTKSSIDTEYTYKHDATYQLLQSIPATKHHRDAETFAYDPVGNRLAGPNNNLTYNYNQNNQLLEKTKERKHDDENVEYTYDKNGNLIKQIEHEHEGKHTKTTLYTYDYENRLIKVETQKHHWQQTVTFAYDPFGRRVSKTIEREKEFEENDHHKEHDKGYDKDDDDHNAIKTTYYVYDNEDILMEYNHKGKITAQYTHGLGIDEPLAFTNKHGETYYYHADGLGSITVLTDNKQKVVQSYSYSSFGVVKRDNDKIKQSYMFTGRIWNSDIELYDYNARWYDAKTGRFTTKDPSLIWNVSLNIPYLLPNNMENPKELNPYLYVQNNPLRFKDPLGLAVFPHDYIERPGTWPPGKSPAGNPETGTKCYKCDNSAVLSCIWTQPATPLNVSACGKCILGGFKDLNSCSLCAGSILGGTLDCIDRHCHQGKISECGKCEW